MYESIDGHDEKLSGLFEGGRGRDRKKKKLYHKVKKKRKKSHNQKKITNATEEKKEGSKWLIVGAS